LKVKVVSGTHGSDEATMLVIEREKISTVLGDVSSLGVEQIIGVDDVHHVEGMRVHITSPP
jgi:hypothetical protein